MSKVRMGKAIVKSFDDIAGYIEKSMHRGMKSPNHLQTTTLKDGGFLQTIRGKNGECIAKCYNPKSGDITTALFTGEQAAVVANNPLKSLEFQPGKLIHSHREIWRGRKTYIFESSKPLAQAKDTWVTTQRTFPAWQEPRIGTIANRSTSPWYDGGGGFRQIWGVSLS